MDSFKYFLTKLMCRSLTPRLVSQVQFQRSAGLCLVGVWGPLLFVWFCFFINLVISIFNRYYTQLFFHSKFLFLVVGT